VTVSTALASWWGWPAAQVWRRLYPRLGLLALAIATLPWFLTITLVSRGDFVRYALGTQILQRVTSGMEEHGGFPGYYLLLSMPAFYPWSAVIPAALCGAWARRKAKVDFAFLLGWIIGPLLFLECLPTKLIHYLLPAYPSCALLAGWLLEAVAADEVTLRRWPLGRLSLGLLGGIGITATVLLLAVATVLPTALRLPLLLLGGIQGAGTLIGMLGLHLGSTRKATVSLAITSAFVILIVGAWLLPAAEPYRTSRRIGERLGELSARTGIAPVLLNYQEPGVIYSMQTRVATVRTPEGFRELLDQKGSLLTVITPEEGPLLRQKHELSVQVIDSIEGFSLTKGRSYILQFAVLKALSQGRPREHAMARAGQAKQTLVE
jgi:4-amino-4-deoxy-L-arabinose transferase-like glycosyltransferase